MAMKENEGGIREEGRELRQGRTQDAKGRCPERGHVPQGRCVASGEGT